MMAYSLSLLTVSLIYVILSLSGYHTQHTTMYEHSDSSTCDNLLECQYKIGELSRKVDGLESHMTAIQQVLTSQNQQLVELKQILIAGNGDIKAELQMIKSDSEERSISIKAELSDFKLELQQNCSKNISMSNNDDVDFQLGEIKMMLSSHSEQGEQIMTEISSIKSQSSDNHVAILSQLTHFQSDLQNCDDDENYQTIETELSSIIMMMSSSGDQHAMILSKLTELNTEVSSLPTQSETLDDIQVQIAQNKALIQAHDTKYGFNYDNYAIISENSTWGGAKRTCLDNGGFLVALESAEEWEFVQALANIDQHRDQCNYGYYWTAGRLHVETNNWMWRPINGNHILYKWMDGEPNNLNDECVEMTPTGHLNNKDCHQMLCYICEYENN